MVEPMKIRTSHCYPDDPDAPWAAVDDDTYDGAEDSSHRNMIGYGATRAEAIADLMRLIQEDREYREDLEHKARDRELPI
jgi:hypothetical protein